MNRAITILRAMKRQGAAMQALASKAVRARGWKLVQDAKRAARRLGVEGML